MYACVFGCVEAYHSAMMEVGVCDMSTTEVGVCGMCLSNKVGFASRSKGEATSE